MLIQRFINFELSPKNDQVLNNLLKHDSLEFSIKNTPITTVFEQQKGLSYNLTSLLIFYLLLAEKGKNKEILQPALN